MLLEGLISVDDMQELAESFAVEMLDYESILDECKSSLQEFVYQKGMANTDVASLPISDPMIKIMEVLAYRELHLRQRLNESVKSCSLQSAKLKDLESIYRIFSGGEILKPGKDVVGALFQDHRDYHTAGSEAAYKHHVLKALRNGTDTGTPIVDIHVVSQEEACVSITVLFDAQISGAQRQEYLDAITRHLYDEDIRPIGQKVDIDDAYIKPYQIVAELGLDETPGTAQIVEKSRQDVKQYVDGRYRLGKDIYRSGLLSALHQPGVRYIILHSLTNYTGGGDLKVMEHEAALCERIDVRVDVNLPNEKVLSAWIEKIRRSRERMSFELLITPPEHEIRISSYAVYWANANGRKLVGPLPIANIPAGGGRNTWFTDLVPPNGAQGIVIYTANQNGEMESGYPLAFPKDFLE